MSHHSNFLWIAGFAIITLSVSITSGQEVKAGVTSAQIERTPPPANQLGPVETELIAVIRAQFPNPEARQNALRQWHEKNGAALKAEVDSRNEAQRPAHEALQNEANKRFEESLGNQINAGRIGKLEAELISLTRLPFKSDEQRLAIIAQWRTEKGAALDAERDNRRSAEAPHLVALRAQERALRHRQIQQAQQNGKIGPREAELMQLRNNQGEDPAMGQEEIRKWMVTHGAELKAEVDARSQRMLIKPTLPDSQKDPAAP